MRLTNKQKQQIIAPIIVVIVIIALFAGYHLIKIYKAAQEGPVVPTEEGGPPVPGLIICEDLGCPEGSQYIGSSESNVYHECSSGYAQTILPQNRMCFYNATEAEQAGYRPAAK